MTPDPSPSASPQPSRGPRRWLRIVLAIAAILVLACVIAVVLVVRKIHTVPDSWTRARQSIANIEPQQLRDAADDLESRLLREASDILPNDAATNSNVPVGGTRTIVVPMADANAWLNSRLAEWLANQNQHLPPGVSNPSIAADNEGLIFSCQYDGRGLSGILSARFVLKTLPGEKAAVALTDLRVGDLPLPVHMLTDSIFADLAARAPQRLMPWASGLRTGESFEPLIPVDRARDLRLIDAKFNLREVAFTFRTEKHESRR